MVEPIGSTSSQPTKESIAEVPDAAEEAGRGQDLLATTLRAVINEAFEENVKGYLSVLHEEQYQLIVRIDSLIKMMRKSTVSTEMEMVERASVRSSLHSTGTQPVCESPTRKAILQRCTHQQNQPRRRGKVDIADLLDTVVCETIGPAANVGEELERVEELKSPITSQTPRSWMPLTLPGRSWKAMFAPTPVNKIDLHADSIVPHSSESPSKGTGRSPSSPSASPSKRQDGRKSPAKTRLPHKVLEDGTESNSSHVFGNLGKYAANTERVIRKSFSKSHNHLPSGFQAVESPSNGRRVSGEALSMKLETPALLLKEDTWRQHSSVETMDEESDPLPLRLCSPKQGDEESDSDGTADTMEMHSSTSLANSSFARMHNYSRANSMYALRAKTELEILSRDGKKVSIYDQGPLLCEEAPRSLLQKVAHRAPTLILQISGVLPFECRYFSECYTGLVFVAMFAISIFSAILGANGDDKVSVHLISLCLATGNFLGLCSLRWNGIQNFVGNDAKTLEMYACKFEFLNDWFWDSSWHAVPITVLWFLAIFARSVTAVECSDDWNNTDTWIPLLFYVIACGGFASLTYCQVHIVSGLQLMVENWCMRYFRFRDVNNGMAQWNTLQAVLRRTASIIETSIFLLQTCMLASFGVVGVEALDNAGLFAQGTTCAGLWGLSAALPMAMSLYAMFLAGVVTEKCMRVPSLLNSIAVDNTSDDPDTSCFKLVEYVTHSAAGFYVKGIRVTAFMVVKLAYIFAALAFALALHFVRAQSP